MLHQNSRAFNFFRLLGFALGLISLGLIDSLASSILAGGIDVARLKELKAQNNPNYGTYAKAVIEAVEFSTARPVQRSKLPGVYRFYFETGAAATDVNDRTVAVVSKVDSRGDRFAPDGYESWFAKAGIGLPYGIITELGGSYVFGKHSLASVFGNLALQALDFDRMVVTDMVPSIALATSLNYNYLGPKTFNIGFTGLVGAYHRYFLAQINYVFQFTYGILQSPSYKTFFIRHGISSYWPLYEGLYVTTEVYYKPIQVGLILGYQF